MPMYSDAPSKTVDPDLGNLMTAIKRNPRAMPYSRPSGRLAGPPPPRYTPADPNAPGSWKHDLFGSNKKGGALALRLDTEAQGNSTRGRARGADGELPDLLDPSLDLGTGVKQRGNTASSKPSLADRLGAGGVVRTPRGAAATAVITSARSNQAASRAPPAIPTRHATTTATRPAVPAAVPSGPGLSIKGKSGKTVVEVANLAQGTSAEDVKMTFESFGEVEDARVTRETREAVSVQVEFKFASSAHKAVEAFNNQLADGRVLSVSIKEIPPPPPPPAGPRATAPASRSTAAVPAAQSGSALFSRLGLPAITKAGGAAPPPASGARSATGGGGDLMDGFGSASKMYSDSLANSGAAPSSSGRGFGGRGGGRRRATAAGSMDID